MNRLTPPPPPRLPIAFLKRWLPRLLILTLLGAGAAYLIAEKPWVEAAPAPTYQTVAVGKGQIAAQVTATGTLSARGTVLVGAQVSGRVLELHADFNDQVKKGQIIAKLDASLLQAQLDQAEAAHDLAIANHRKAEVSVLDARRQRNRQNTLHDQGLIAGAAAEAADTAYQVALASQAAAKAQVHQAAANLKQARTSLSYATIYSPVDGVVLSRAVDVGQTVAASLQAPTLFTIAQDLARMQIDTAVAEADVGRLKDGMKATFVVDAFPGKAFDGVVRQVRNAPTTTSGVVTYDAVIDVDNKDKSLRPGMTANVTFVLSQVQDAVKIPNAALRFKPTREQMQAMRGSKPGSRGAGQGRGQRQDAASGAPGGGGKSGAAGGGSDGRGGVGMAPDGRPHLGDKKPVWKLEAGQPRLVLVKPGQSDGMATELLEGDLKPGDLLITEVSGVAASAAFRRVSPF